MSIIDKILAVMGVTPSAPKAPVRSSATSTDDKFGNIIHDVLDNGEIVGEDVGSDSRCWIKVKKDNYTLYYSWYSSIGNTWSVSLNDMNVPGRYHNMISYKLRARFHVLMDAYINKIIDSGKL